ncbi:hypothetical protein SAMN02745165_01927 [Malonomonas rubra DSM 5091]|uniref:DNA-binding beta-propeller fold protein YncE n=2 Tax=Malonomonas rubra TaxID=57040 RepID=A0A1M6HYJ9_MALRU|nr:hypothetical protein SAMN02745165_01927 [Malonomonas rubra DSM 5091]
MRISRIKLSVFWRFLASAMFFLLAASCTLTPVEPTPVVDPGATLHLYLQPLPQEVRSLSLRIATLNAVRTDGEEFPLLANTLELNPAQRISRQTKLLSRQLPPGDYLGISLLIDQAAQASEEGPIALLTETEAKLLKNPFQVRADQATPLFLSLSSDRLVTDGYRLTAKFSLWSGQPPLTELKGLVSHPTTGSLSFFEKKTPLIFSVLALGQQPTGLALDQAGRRAYVSLSGEDAIVAIDLVRQQVERKIRLRPGDRPQRLSLSDRGQRLLVSLPGGNAVSIVDTQLFRELQRVHFITRPAEVISAANSQRAYVLLPETNGIALIDAERGSIDASVSLPETPTFGSLSSDGKTLFLLTETSPDLLLLDSQSLQLRGRVFVGYGATCLATAANGLLYVGMQSGVVQVIDPRVELAIDQFPVGGAVRDLIQDRQENSLFVLTNRQQLEKYDLISKRRQATLELGMDGFEATLMGEQ